MAGSDIMTKLFYIIVPYTPALTPVVKPTDLPFLGTQKTATPLGIDAAFEEHKVQLEQRMALVAGGLSGTGLRAVPLQTEEVIELLYRSFNVGELETPIKAEAPQK